MTENGAPKLAQDTERGVPVGASRGTADLIARLEQATGPDRMLDLAISVAINFKDVFAPLRGAEFAWSAFADEIDVIDNGKRVGCLDPVQFVPQWTGSLDAAVQLVPPEWFWRVGYTTLFQGWANVHETHPDHGDPNHNEFHYSRRWDARPISTPTLCLCIAALRARFSKVGQRWVKAGGRP